MSGIAYVIIFVLPLLAFVALTRTIDDESPWRLREAVIFNITLAFIGVILLTIVERVVGATY